MKFRVYFLTVGRLMALAKRRSSHDPLGIPNESSAMTEQFLDTAFVEPPVSRPNHSQDKLVIICYFLVLICFVLCIASTWLYRLSSTFLLPALSSCNIVLFGITGVFHHHLATEVKKERRKGYLSFSYRLEHIVWFPFVIVTCGNMLCFLVVVWQYTIKAFGIPPLLLLRIFLLVEIAMTGVAIALCFWEFHVHDASQPQPDAMNWLYSPLHPPTSLGDIRCVVGNRLADQQATLLHYQQESLSYLSEEILRLQETLGKYEASRDGSTPQVDVAHLLEGCEQELRAVTAERDQLQAEIRLARSLVTERDGEISRIRTLNDKYVEENERLRAMLEEWSSRTAKLELALEAERLSNADLHKKMTMLRQSSVGSA